MAAVAAGLSYLSWRVSTLHGAGTLGVAFFLVEALNFLSLALAAGLFWNDRRRPASEHEPRGTLAVFITVCGEPPEIVARTLRAALAIAYPHRTYLLNDGRLTGKPTWAAIEELGRRHGVPCFTRTSGRRGKAGNLNAALGRIGEEFVAVIDADHRARPDLADQLLGYFADPQVAFVTTPQHFQVEGPDVLGNRELLFYGRVQPAKDRHHAAFSCGNGVVYRRRALESIGGFSEWNLVEDLHTSYQLHSRGWDSVYHRAAVTIGTAPSTVSAFAKQRLLWATDSLRILLWDNPLAKRGLSLMQRLHYLQTVGFYLVVATQTLFIVSPALSLLWGISVMHPSSPRAYVLHAGPYLALVVLLLTVHGGPAGALRVLQQQLYLAPLYCIALLRALSGQRFPSTVTEKARQSAFSWLVVPQKALIGLLLAAVATALLHPRRGLELAGVWAAVMTLSLTTLAGAISVRRRVAQALRIVVRGAVGVAVVALLWVGTPSSGPRLFDFSTWVHPPAHLVVPTPPTTPGEQPPTQNGRVKQ